MVNLCRICRTVPLALLALLLPVGCAARVGSAELPATPALVYTSTTGIVALEPRPGSKQGEFLLAERAEPGRVRLRQWDLRTGKMTDLDTVSSLVEDPLVAVPLDGFAAYARDGSLAVVERRERGQSIIRVRRAGRTWQAAPGSKERFTQLLLAWSPDASALLYVAFTGGLGKRGQPSIRLHAAEQTNHAGPLTHRQVLAAQPDNRAVWSRDGRTIYVCTTGAQPKGPAQVIGVTWPSLAPRVLCAAGATGGLSAAEESGHVVWFASVDDDAEQAWRMAPGGTPAPTPLTFAGAPWDSTVSPDGRLLAAMIDMRTVAVGDLDDGAVRELGRLEGARSWKLHWALGGRALLLAVGPKGKVDKVWLIPVEGAGPGAKLPQF